MDEVDKSMSKFIRWLIVGCAVIFLIFAGLAIHGKIAAGKVRKKLETRMEELKVEIDDWCAASFTRKDRPGLIDGNAAEGYEKIFKKIEPLYKSDEWRKWERADWKDRNWEDVNPILDDVAALLPELKRIQNMRTVDWELDYRKGYALMLPMISDARRLSKLLDAQRIRFALGKDWQNAADVTLALCQLGADIDQAGCLVTTLVGIAFAITAFEMDNMSFGSWDLSPDYWKYMAKRLDHLYDEHTRVEELLRNERIMAEWTLGIILAKNVGWMDSIPVDNAADVNFSDENTRDIIGSGHASLGAVSFWENMVYLREKYGEIIEFYRSDPSMKELEEFQESLEDFMDDTRKSRSRKLVCLVMPQTTKCFMKIIRYRAMFRVFHAAVSLKYHCAVHGSFPKTLDGIDGNILPDEKHLVDPYGKKPLRYSLSSDGKTVTVWSIGPDMVDDSGKVKLEKKRGQYLGDILIEFKGK
ncbi:MAG: hypothetical protein ACYS8W_10895 [Planctomycetota bacterium]|jgi:hypothetical protein